MRHTRVFARFVLACWLLAPHATKSWTTPTNADPAISRRRLFVDATTRSTNSAAVAAMASWFAVLDSSPAWADDECDEACRERRLQIIGERRAMMQQSRSTTSRQEVFDLSRQRAALLYNTTYQGASCPPGLPCL